MVVQRLKVLLPDEECHAGDAEFDNVEDDEEPEGARREPVAIDHCLVRVAAEPRHQKHT